MKRYIDLINECLESVEELMPWDLEVQLESSQDLLLLDIREPYEFETMHIKGSLNVPRGILEQACEWDFEETLPGLVEARDRDIVIICRSGNRSVLAACTMQSMGYQSAKSLKTGLKGWNDYEQPLVDANDNEVDIDDAEEYFKSTVTLEQTDPQRRIA